MNSSKQLENNEIRALAMIVIGRCANETNVESAAKAVLDQYLQSIEIFENYNQQISNKKYESDGIVSKK
jgi:hypothetical protein